MTGMHGRKRRLRRNIRCGGWIASMAVAIAAGMSMAAGSSGNGALAAGLVIAVAAVLHPWMKREGGVPVLIYHSVTADGAWLPWSGHISVTPELFARNLETLRKLECTVIRTEELVEARRSGRPLGRRPVVIHFDDGYLDNWVAAMPLLKRFDLPATVFVSTDFIEPGNALRPSLDDVDSGQIDAAELQWDGYLNWSELRALQESGLIAVEAHGVDHGRVAAGPGTEGDLTRENWRRHAWMQWQRMDGNKSGWYRAAEPPCVPVGTPIPESASALAARAWRDGDLESQSSYEQRVAASLRAAKSTLESGLDKTVRFFCWPYNETNPRAHELALEAGFVATTGGDGENRPGDDPAVISRYHVGAGAFGWPQPMLDDLVFRANLRLFHGNYYWGLLVLPLNAGRSLLRLLWPFQRAYGARS